VNASVTPHCGDMPYSIHRLRLGYVDEFGQYISEVDSTPQVVSHRHGGQYRWYRGWDYPLKPSCSGSILLLCR